MERTEPLWLHWERDLSIYCGLVNAAPSPYVIGQTAPRRGLSGMLGWAIGMRFLPLPGSAARVGCCCSSCPGPAPSPGWTGRAPPPALPLPRSHRQLRGAAGGPSRTAGRPCRGAAAVLSLSLRAWGPSKTPGSCRRCRPSGGVWILSRRPFSGAGGCGAPLGRGCLRVKGDPWSRG